MGSFTCEFCSKTFTKNQLLIIHQKKTSKCIALQVKKLGNPKFEPPNIINVTNEDSLESLKYLDKHKENSPKTNYIDTSPKNTSKEPEILLEEQKTSSNDSFSKLSTPQHISTKQESYEDIEFDIDNFQSSSNYTSSDDEEEEIIVNYKPKEHSKSSNKDQINSKLDKILAKLDSITNKDVIKEIQKVHEDLKQTTENQYKKYDKSIKDIKSNITSIEQLVSSNDSSHVINTLNLIRAQFDVKQDSLEIIKENLDDLCDNYYSLYKKFKYLRDDMESLNDKRRSYK